MSAVHNYLTQCCAELNVNECSVVEDTGLLQETYFEGEQQNVAENSTLMAGNKMLQRTYSGNEY